MRPIDADALCEALLERWNTADQNAEEIISELMAKVVTPIVVGMPTIEPSKSDDQNVADVPSGDLISREDAIEAVMAEGRNVHASEYANAERIIHEADAVEALAMLTSADRPTIKQTDTLIIADALRYLVQDTERHESDRTRAEELRKQILQYGASMCHSADRPNVAYICDGRKCDKDCSECFRTLDIEHARDFKLLGDTYYQQEQADRPTDKSCRDCPIYSADRPQVNSNSAEEQIAETCDKPKVNSAEWVEQKEREFEELNRPKGEWKWRHGGECSECGFRNNNFDFNFCPHCGADMRGENDG